MKDQRRSAWGVLLIAAFVFAGTSAILGAPSQADEIVFETGKNDVMYPDTLMVEFRAEILVLHECYQEVMMMAPWRIEAEFWDLEDETLAQAGANPYYFNALIRYDLVLLSEETTADVRGTVVHEMMHILQWELGLLAESASETQAEYNYALGLQEKLSSRVEMWPSLVDACAG